MHLLWCLGALLAAACLSADAEVVKITSPYYRRYSTGRYTTLERQADPHIPSHKHSFAVVIDTSGSMHDDIQQALTASKQILAAALAQTSKPIQDMVLVPFKDPGVGPVTVTRSSSKFRHDLGRLRASGGGDCPELAGRGIKLALEATYNRSFIYVFTDASAKDGHLKNDILRLIQQKQSQVVFVMTGKCGTREEPLYRAIAEASGGQIFSIRRGEINQVLAFVKDSFTKHKVGLLSTDKPRGGYHIYPITVDPQMTSVVVSLTGPSARIVYVKDQRGSRMSYSNLVNAANAKVVRITTRTGDTRYKVQIYSSGSHEVRITGHSNLDFDVVFHGYGSTTEVPVAGSRDTVEVTPEGLGSGRMTYVYLVSPSGTTLASASLTKVYGTTNKYRSSTITIPSSKFHVKVYGTCQTGQSFHRSTMAMITPRMTSKPAVTMKSVTSGRAGGNIFIHCSVHSAVPYTVAFYDKDNQQVGSTQRFTSTAVAKLNIPKACKCKSGQRYTCAATNAAGTNRAYTRLSITG